MFFDVSLQRDESLVDEVRNFLIGIGLSFQLSTCASSGRRRKIDQERFVFTLSLFQCGISVFDPIDEHSSLLQTN